MGGQSGPVYRDNLEIKFALFRPGKVSAVMNTTMLAQPSANVSDSLMQTMDRVANRVSHELKKK
jgi:predicted Zn-dependent protease